MKGIKENIMEKKKIYCFIQREGPGSVSVAAMCEDGHVLAEHFSSNVSWAHHDIGITSDWQHDKYSTHCPYGFELIWIETPEAMRQMTNKAGPLYNAYLKNQELAKEAKATP